jgi:uncharacterized protein YjbJ (UPF0337 family)
MEVNMRDDTGVWDRIKGNWKQVKGKVREKWGLLSGDDLEHIAGHKDRLIGKIQEKYGKSKWKSKRIEQELRTIDQTPPAGDETER